MPIRCRACNRSVRVAIRVGNYIISEFDPDTRFEHETPRCIIRTRLELQD